ncbi:sigma-70 family RNA polymerase sigma factor [Schlesneria paludicola]|uniref:sigma-70 family RNA polymerase sigma factor n=1 Tax=Schlesneria paludicola TaxID=360056 RepID=UPI00029A4848|nr:sigma-70 family RNA polymerase sigma factor [Schlesneria paludicola]
MVEPLTRASLMLRLRDPQDQQAWTQFVSIYEPLILRLLRQRGLQEADARDVAQQVVLAVTQAVDRWQPDGRDASFRRWLFAIARKMALKFLQRGAKVNGPARRGAGGTDMFELLQNLPEPDHRTVADFDEEYRNEVFAWAAEQVRQEFRDSTWQAFWRTCVLHEPIAQVAEGLGMTAGSIYVARTRVIARLRRFVEDCEANHGG